MRAGQGGRISGCSRPVTAPARMGTSARQPRRKMVRGPWRGWEGPGSPSALRRTFHFTVTVAIILGWIEQMYLYTPALVNVKE